MSESKPARWWRLNDHYLNPQENGFRPINPSHDVQSIIIPKAETATEEVPITEVSGDVYVLSVKSE